VPHENVLVNNLAIGNIVTFSYDIQARRHIPVNPKINRLRTDLLWKDVVYLYNKENASLSGTSHSFPFPLSLSLYPFLNALCLISPPHRH
jgi:hypothetical protein